MLPDGFPGEVEAIACDLDRTLIWTDVVLRPRTKAAITAAQEAGIHVVVVTGRMFRSVRPYVLGAGIHDPVVCYQGAVVADPVSGEFLRHVPMPLEDALEVIGEVEERGFGVLCYVDDELFVGRETVYSARYATFQKLTVNPVGDLRSWLRVPPTKLVCVDEPERIDALKPVMKEHFGNRLFISKSLPQFLEFAHPDVTKGSGLGFLAERLGFAHERTIAFGDGENDLELLEWAGYGIAVANADPQLAAIADWICPSAEVEGVAQVIEAMLAAR